MPLAYAIVTAGKNEVMFHSEQGETPESGRSLGFHFAMRLLYFYKNAATFVTAPENYNTLPLRDYFLYIGPYVAHAL